MDNSDYDLKYIDIDELNRVLPIPKKRKLLAIRTTVGSAISVAAAIGAIVQRGKK